MISGNNHEYKFGIIAFSILVARHRIQSDSHLWLHQAWIIRMTAKLFPLSEIYIDNCCERTFVGMRKGNLIFLRRAIWIAAVERTRNDPYRRTNATTTRTARNPISFCQEKCSASSKIIYPAWMSWICSFWFSSTTRARFASIILIYFTHPDISFCLPFGFDIPIKMRHFHPSRLLSFRSVTSCSRKMRVERSGMRENNLENDHHMVSSMLFRDNFLPSSSRWEKNSVDFLLLGGIT